MANLRTPFSILCSCSNAKHLPFHEHGLVTYNYNAFVHGLIPEIGCTEDFQSNCYIQLSSPAHYTEKHLLSFVPNFGIEALTDLRLGSSKSLKSACGYDAIDTVISAINEGYYTRVVLDDFYLPGRNAFKISHFNHDYLVTGYCANCRRLSMAGYHNSEMVPLTSAPMGRFCVRMTHIEHIIQASQSKLGSGATNIGVGEFFLFRPRATPMPIDREFIRSQYLDYIFGRHCVNPYIQKRFPLDSVCPWANVNRKIVYGFYVYDELKSYLTHFGELLKAAESPQRHRVLLDLRPFTLLLEHKVLMNRRIRYLGSRAGGEPALLRFAGESLEIMRLAEVVRLLAMSIRRNGDSHQVRVLVEKLASLKRREEPFLARVVRVL